MANLRVTPAAVLAANTFFAAQTLSGAGSLLAFDTAGTNAAPNINPTANASGAGLDLALEAGASTDTGTNNRAGGVLRLLGGLGTGTGSVGNVIITTGVPTASGTTPHTYANAATFKGTLAAATGNEIAYNFAYTVNKASSGNDTGLQVNMTDTASPGTSLLGDFQVGGTSQWKVDNTGAVTQVGVLTLPNGAVGAPSVNVGDATTGIYRSASNEIGFTCSGAVSWAVLAAGVLRSSVAGTIRPAGTSAAGNNMTLQAGNTTTVADQAGGNLTLADGVGTGTGAGGTILLKTGTTLTTGTTAQTLVTRMTIGKGDVTTDRFSITFADACDFVIGSTTGTKFGTATTQKLSFYNNTPIVRGTAFTQTYSTATHTFSARTANYSYAAPTGTAVTPTGFANSTDFNAAMNQIVNLGADLAVLQGVVNGWIDDAQALGLTS